MAVEAIKSTSITNSDTSPPLANTAGEGAAAEQKWIDDYVTMPAAASIGSVLRVVRIPTTAKVKSVVHEAGAQGAGAYDIGLYYSSSVNDSSGAAALAGAVIDADFFSAAVNNAAAITPTERVGGNLTAYPLTERNTPIWQAAGLSADPGGFFDVALTVATTDVTTGTGKVGLRVGFAR